MPVAPSLPRHSLVVIPARNEAATVADVVREVRAALATDVLVVDDYSDDGTDARALAAGARVLRLSHQLGAWGATQTGIRYARKHGYRHVLAMDADGQHHAASLPRMLDELQQHDVDVMIGSCEARLSRAKRLAWAYFRLLTGVQVRDFTSGMRVYGPHAVELLACPDASLLDYQDIGVLLLLKKKGLQMAEMTVPMAPRRDGTSRVFSSWPTVARYMLGSTVLCLARLDRGGRTHGRQHT